jgi:hypothetical protein
MTAIDRMAAARAARKPRQSLSNTTSGALESLLTPRQVKRLGQWNPSRHRDVKALFSGACKSRKLALKYQCLECVGEDVAAVRGCTADTCPLWRFRPYKP